VAQVERIAAVQRRDEIGGPGGQRGEGDLGIRSTAVQIERPQQRLVAVIEVERVVVAYRRRPRSRY
jgi:hypothetical protein